MCAEDKTVLPLITSQSDPRGMTATLRIEWAIVGSSGKAWIVEMKCIDAASDECLASLTGNPGMLIEQVSAMCREGLRLGVDEWHRRRGKHPKMRNPISKS